MTTMLEADFQAKLASHPPLDGLIIEDFRLLGGKPALFGTRLSVEQLLEERAAGCTPEQLLKSYPTLYPRGVEAALSYTEKLPASHPLAQMRPASCLRAEPEQLLELLPGCAVEEA